MHSAVASTSGAAGTSSGAQGTSGVSSALRSQRTHPAAAVQGTDLIKKEREGALRIYSTNIGSTYINAAALKENNPGIAMPEGNRLDLQAIAEYNRGHSASEYVLGQQDVLKAAATKIHSSPESARSLMKDAVSNLNKASATTYYRGTYLTDPLKHIKVGDFVKTDFFMSVTTDKNVAIDFASGRYRLDQSVRREGVLYDIVGAPRHFPYGELKEKEGIYNTGTIFEFTSMTIDRSSGYPCIHSQNVIRDQRGLKLG